MFPLSAVEVLFAPTKSTQKSAPGRSLSILVRKIFLKLSHGAIRKLIAQAPKIAHQQREMICAILRQFLQKLFLQTVIPLFTAVFIKPQLCATE